MNPNDPNVYDEKALRRHIERVEAYSYCNGIMRWCPCGDEMVQQFIDGTRYILCEKHKIGKSQFDNWLHYRRRWDEVVWEQVVCLKAENETQEKQMCELTSDIFAYKWQIGHLKAEAEKQERLIRELICDRDQNKRDTENLKAQLDHLFSQESA